MMKKNKLYTVNRWNRPAFMPKENLFAGPFGSSQMQISGYNPLANLSPQQMNQLKVYNASAMSPTLTTSSLGMGTINKGGIGAIPETDPAKFLGVGSSTKKGGSWLGLSKEANPFSKQNLAGVGKAIGNAGLSIGAGLVGSIGGSLISGGLQSEAGSTISNIGGTIGGAVGAVNPVAGAIIGAGSQILGGVTNALFGTSVDSAKLNEVNQNISALNSFTSNAGSFDEIQGPQAVSMDTSVYSGGVFSGASARRKNRELKRKLINAKQFASRSVENNINNLVDDQMNDALANYAAYGGPLGFGGGALDYDIMSDMLTIKKKNEENKDKMTNLFMGSPSTMFDFGGDLQVHGGDFGTGLTHIDAGNSHEENPYDGVQMGVDQEGTPNLVEEGETVYDDYVFSNRILADESTKKLFRLPKKKDITFADISKRLEKEIAERPNDPISEAGFKAQMQTLEEQQERQKQEMEAERAKAAFEALTPEEQTALMQQKAQQEAMTQEAAMQQQAMAEQQAAQEQPTPEEMAMMQQQADGTEANVGQAPVMAEGGNLYAGGSKLKPYAYSKTWDGFNYFDPAKDAYDEGYLNFVKRINQDWVDRILKGQYGSMDRYLAKNKGVALTPEQVAALATDKKYSDMHKAVAAAYKEHLAGIDPKTGKPVEQAAAPERGGQVYIAGENGVTPVDESSLDDTYTIEDFDGVKIARKKAVEAAPASATTVTPEVKPEVQVEPEIEPVKKADWMRYAGLFGPAVGLGMMATGVGKPDYSGLDAAVSSAGNVALAKYKPIGNYLTYRPMDIWFEQNRMDANARATDRAIMNNAAPIGTKMAGLLASGYNNQIADGELYRKALEYNDAKRKEVAEFNRGTNQFNAEAYNRNSQFNASALNDAYSRNVNARLQAAQERLNRDAGWYNSLYGNLSSLFKGISDLGRENRETNWRNALVTSGAMGVLDPDQLVKAGVAKYKNGKKSSKGGKINKKRGLTY